jgi:DNA helicase-2/ATP-dependent DNA helicase PcrA
MPTCFTAFFDSFPVVMVDEAQDLSALNHVLLHKLIGKKGRLIAVGDQCQSIYGFRGAHEEGMQVLAEEFAMTELRLSISFRCPINIVCEAQWRAPHMRWPDWALPGTVHRAPSWSILDIPEDAAIICRNNAPLFTTAIRLLKNGRYPELVGNDIGKNLMKTMAKFGNKNVSREALLTCIDRWEAEKKNKSRAPKRISDQAECMRIFARQGKTLGDAIAYGEHILAAAGPVKLMTGHKSKGLEFNHVFFLDEFLLGDEGQELNLKYVIQTRSKSTLTYITSDGFTEEGFTDA